MGTDQSSKGDSVQRQGPESPDLLALTLSAAQEVPGGVVAEEWGLRRPEGVSVSTVAGAFQLLTTSTAVPQSLN